IWLNHGNLIGDDTDGHIDTIVRIAPEDTLLYVKCSDEGDEHYEDFMALEKELKLLKTADGKAYRLIPLPFPKAIYDSDGERLPATYANYLIINGAVLVPTYNQPDMDKEACEIIGKAFKDREIIPIDSRVIIRQHGSIHCLTMQYY
ncbi:MAG: agmatine deiminase family protein, partial [Prevotella sp.]|nr:agmatine deiminase family protein [Prevotella sp.]